MGDSPEGPFTMTGVIMDESETGCWTNHHSMIEYNNQWYLFYHHNDYSPHFDKNRSVCIDSLFFNADGTIQKVIPTKRGVGLTAANEKIQLDRYSDKSENVKIVFNDTTNTFAGWKTVLENKDAWISYNAVNFEKKNTGKVVVNARALNGGKVELRIDALDGPVLAEISVPKGTEMTVSKTKMKKVKPGIHNLFVVAANNNPVEIDWISFE